MAIEREIKAYHSMDDSEFRSYERAAEINRERDIRKKCHRDSVRAPELAARSRRRHALYPVDLLKVAAEALTIAEQAERDGMKVSAATVIHLCEALLREYSIDVSEFIAD
jgi:hypothetical protein